MKFKFHSTKVKERSHKGTIKFGLYLFLQRYHVNMVALVGGGGGGGVVAGFCESNMFIKGVAASPGTTL